MAKPSPEPNPVLQFGPYSLDRLRLELHRDGAPVHLQLQPLRLLTLLVSDPGRVVSRDRIRDEIWGHAYLEVDQGINFCIRQIRAALEDDARNPRFVETVPRRGYRFIASVSSPEPSIDSGWSRGRFGAVAFAGVLTLAAAVTGIAISQKDTSPPTAVAGDPASSHLIPQGALDAYRRALVHLERGSEDADIEAAHHLLKSAVATDPDFAAAHAQLAIALSSMAWATADPSFLDEANDHAERARRLDPDLPEVLHALGHMSFHRRDLGAALASFEAALDRQPDQLASLLSLGHTQQRLGQWAAARATFERAFALDPRSAQATYALARTHHFLRDFGEEERYLDHLAAIDPQHWLPLVSRAVMALAVDGDTAEAWSWIRQAESDGAAAAVALNSSALTRVFAERIVDELGPALEDAREAMPFELFEYRMGVLFTHSGQGELAREYFERSRVALEARLSVMGLDKSQFHGEATAVLAAIYAGLGDFERAEALASKAARSIPLASDEVAGVRTRHRVAEVLATIGHTDRALDHIEYLITRPSLLTPALLEVDPVWLGLQGVPRGRL